MKISSEFNTLIFTEEKSDKQLSNKMQIKLKVYILYKDSENCWGNIHLDSASCWYQKDYNMS